MSKQPPKIGPKKHLVSEIESHNRTAAHWKHHCDEITAERDAFERVANELEAALRLCFPYEDERAEIKAKALAAFAMLKQFPSNKTENPKT